MNESLGRKDSQCHSCHDHVDAGSGECKELSLRKQANLEQVWLSLLPNAMASVSDAGRLFLLEVACSPDSVLSQVAQEKFGKRSDRCSLWNGFDLTTGEGVKNVKKIKLEKPKYVWVATECGAFSPIQNCNQNTEEQRQALLQKQREARKQHIGGLLVAEYAKQQGSVVFWEWSRRCRAWKWEMMDQWRRKHQTTTAIIAGCQVGLIDDASGKPLGKEWRVECTDDVLGRKLHMPCACVRGLEQHALCEGRMTRKSAYYTPEFARRVLYHTVHRDDYEQVMMELTRDPEEKVVATTQKMAEGCKCRQIQKWNPELVCGKCMFKGDQLAYAGNDDEEHRMVVDDPEGNQETNQPMDGQPEAPLSAEEIHRIKKDLYLLHSATGHGSNEVLVRALRSRGVRPQVIKLAQEFHCSVCAESKRPDPRKRATLDVHMDRWRGVQMDGAFWRHPTTNKQIQFILMMDEASRFLVSKLVNTGDKKGIKGSDYIDMFEQKWKPYFGVPDMLRTDPEGAWRSKEIDEHFSKQGILMDKIPAEAHWNLSQVERGIQWVKELLTKIAKEDPDADVDLLVNQATYVWNHKEVVRGYSPFHMLWDVCQMLRVDFSRTEYMTYQWR